MTTPQRRTAAVPTFSAPDTPMVDPTNPAATTTPVPPPAASPAATGDDIPRDLPVPKRVTAAATRTTSSATSDEDQAVSLDVVAGVVVALVGLSLTIAATLIRRARPGRTLRRPDDKLIGDFAAPLARIGMRHFEVAKLNKDLGDAIIATGAVGRYIEQGPMTQRAVVDAGVPGDLQEDQ